MGNTLTIADLKIRIVLSTMLLVSISVTTVAFMPKATRILTAYSISRYMYRPSQAVVSEVDTHLMPPAHAVPVLMYHGVTSKQDDINTSLANFISQMEMLKRNGYETISVSDYDLFLQGKFILPPRPIIITFDDGRKDSYYQTDDILEHLGFKATIFVASGPAYDGNSFYLGWDELKQMSTSGRWEIEAHGRESHHRIPISVHDENPQGDGRYLVSLMYLPDQHRLETVEEFKNRVESDYENNIRDLETRVGVEPRYFAIPLNDYGQQALSNYVDAASFNSGLIKKYFRIAFIQANNSTDVYKIRLPIYNRLGEDPYLTRRLEVENMSADFLRSILESERPGSWSGLKDVHFLHTTS